MDPLLAIEGVWSHIMEHLVFHEWTHLRKTSRDVRTVTTAYARVVYRFLESLRGESRWVRLTSASVHYVPVQIQNYQITEDMCRFFVMTTHEKKIVAMEILHKTELLDSLVVSFPEYGIYDYLMGVVPSESIHSIYLLGGTVKLPRTTFQKHAMFDVMDEYGYWWEARFVEWVDSERGHFHFCTWEDRWNIVLPIDSPQIQPLHTFTRPWKESLRCGSQIEYRLENGLWCKGIVYQRNHQNLLVTRADSSAYEKIHVFPIETEDIAFDGTHCFWPTSLSAAPHVMQKWHHPLCMASLHVFCVRLTNRHFLLVTL